MILLCLSLGFGAGIVAQIMNFPMTYADYQRVAHDNSKRKEFYKETLIDFCLIELFFMAILLLLGLTMLKAINSN